MSPSSLPIFPFYFCLLSLAPSFLKRFSNALDTTISIILNAKLPAAVHERLVFSSHQARAALSIQYRPWAFRPGAIEVASSNEGIYRYRLRRRISGDNFPFCVSNSPVSPCKLLILGGLQQWMTSMPRQYLVCPRGPCLPNSPPQVRLITFFCCLHRRVTTWDLLWWQLQCSNWQLDLAGRSARSSEGAGSRLHARC